MVSPLKKWAWMLKMARTNNQEPPLSDPLLEAVAALRRSSKWILLSHEQPDGDTLGCGSAFYTAAARLGKSARWMGPDPIPLSYAFLPAAGRYEVLEELPPAEEGSLLVFIDTTNPERTLSVPGFTNLPSVNIDHHGDNSRFAAVNLVDASAGATAELAWEVLGRLGVPLSMDEAMALYVGLVTDTGRFAYSCTTPRSHRIASNLLEKGVHPELMDRLLYCNWSPEALRLRGRAFSRLDYEKDRGIALTWLSKTDFAETGADYSDTEGLSSDLLRIRDSHFSALLVENNSSVRVSLRSRGTLSAAKVAHRHGGGGHPNAAGMKLPLPLEHAIEILRKEIRDFHG